MRTAPSHRAADSPAPPALAATPCRCRPSHLGAPVDVAALNAPAARRLAEQPHPRTEVDCLVVPGYTPRLLWSGRTLHAMPAEACARAAADLRAGLAHTIIVSGAAVRGPTNEALLMREALLAAGITEDRILVEPCARHTTTNLRNAGRLMHAHGLRSAYVIAPEGAWRSPLEWVLGRLGGQSLYVGFPRLSGFHVRCLVTLGYTVGELAWVRPWHVYFVPSPECLRESGLPSAEGDP